MGYHSWLQGYFISITAKAWRFFGHHHNLRSGIPSRQPSRFCIRTCRTTIPQGALHCSNWSWLLMAVASGVGADVNIVSYCDRILVMDGIIVVGSFVEVSIPQSCRFPQA